MSKKILGFITTILAVLIGSSISFFSQKSAIEAEKEYSFRIENIKSKEQLYEETIDLYQEILNPVLGDSVSKLEINKLTNKFSNVMNRNILYFNEDIGNMIEKTMIKGYNNIKDMEAAKIMRAMAKEVKNDRARIGL